MTLVFPDILLDSLENGHMIIDDNFIVTYWNRWLSINTQISKEQILNKSLKEFYPELNYRVLRRKIKTALRLKTPSFYDPNSGTKFISIDRQKITTSSVKMMQQQVTISPYLLHENRVMISIYDISELYEAKLSLQKEIDKVKLLNETLKADKETINNNIMMVKTSVEGVILDVSTLFCEFFGYNKEDLIGENVSTLSSGNMSSAIYKELWETITAKKLWCGEIENKTAQNTLKWVESRITPSVDKNGEITEFNAVYHDITNKKLLEELNVRDSLTKLYNRSYFDDLISSIDKHKRKGEIDFVLVIADIDHFKSINDTYGHQAGDEALKEISGVLRDSLRTNDVIARWGGEEFVIMLKNISVDDSLAVCEKLRKNVQNCTVNGTIKTTCSFGVTKYIVGESIKGLFKRADDALYEAKNGGRNKVVLKV